jgi:hypothetical protein
MNPFSTANLALAAYALVKSNGTSPDMNSGVITRKVATGVYEVVLPGSDDSQAVLPTILNTNG